MPAGNRLLPSASALHRALVNHQHAFGLEHAGDPALARRGGRQAGAENRVARAFGDRRQRD